MKKILLLFTALILSAGTHAQSEFYHIKGKVIDGRTKETIPGAYLTLKKGKAKGARPGGKTAWTDYDGEFTLDSRRKGNILAVSFVGYLSKRVRVCPPSDSLVIRLRPDTVSLNEITAIAYGTAGNKQKRSPQPAYPGRSEEKDTARNGTHPAHNFREAPKSESAPLIRLKGLVVDQETGECIPGANIGVPGVKGIGTSTNFDGDFAITLPEGKTDIQVSFVGYFTQTFSVTASNDSLTIPLKSDKEMQKDAIRLGWHHSPNTRAPWPAYFSHDSSDAQNPEYRPDIFYPSEKYPLSVFSPNSPQASYTAVRDMIKQGWSNIPTADIRTHELVNYFAYHYPAPHGQSLFRITHHYTDCPWNDGHKLLMIGLKAREITRKKLPSSNLVFLIDTSGSMSKQNCLPLIVSSLKALTARLRPEDRLSVITYGGQSKIPLEGTCGKEKQKILRTLDDISPSYSYLGPDGLETAYALAKEYFIPGGNNRVIIASDGYFNAGKSSTEELEKFLGKKTEENILLSTLRFDNGAYRDETMQALAEKGGGFYAYIDNAREAERVILGQLLPGTAFTLAEEVKIQVEFNPAAISAYRLIGYEYRCPPDGNFHDDVEDRSDLSIGQTMTAVYEIVPAIDPLSPGKTAKKAVASAHTLKMAWITACYKLPNDSTREKIEIPIPNAPVPFSKVHPDVRFAAAVIEFAQLISRNPNKGSSSFEHALSTAQSAKGDAPRGERAEFTQLIRTMADYQ